MRRSLSPSAIVIPPLPGGEAGAVSVEIRFRAGDVRRESAEGHQVRSPSSNVSAGTRIDRTTRVSRSTPSATVIPSCVRATRGSTASTENVPARTIPAEVITPPVTASPLSIASRVVSVRASSRTRAMRKML